MPDNVKNDLITQPTIGQALFNTFVENIKTTTVNMWVPIKKCQLKTWKTTGKRLKMTAGDKIVELTEDRSLFARVLLVSNRGPKLTTQKS